MVLDSRLENERARYKRVILAHHDVVEAQTFIRLAVDARGIQETESTQKILIDALRTAFVVSYGRCFVDSNSNGKALPALHKLVARNFDSNLKRLHDRIIELRHTEFAHSDADVANISVSVHSGSFLVPSSRMMRHASIGQEEFSECERLTQSVVATLTGEIVRLQDYLAPHDSFR